MWDRMCNEDYGHYTGCMDGSVEDQHTLVDVSSHVDTLPPDDDVSRTDDNDEATNRYYDKIIIITVYLSFSPPLSLSLPLFLSFLLLFCTLVIVFYLYRQLLVQVTSVSLIFHSLIPLPIIVLISIKATINLVDYSRTQRLKMKYHLSRRYPLPSLP